MPENTSQDDENQNVIPGTDQTHPLPSDLNDDGTDSTGGNAPYSPADISPLGHDDVFGDEQGEDSTPKKSSSKKHHQPGASYDTHAGDQEG